jgi:lipoyl-dependent peroxiredoxin
MNVLYTAEATATGGRDGRARTSDGVLDLSLKPPKELGGPGGDTTNPEQLFAAGYGACYLSALSLIARSQKISARKFSVRALVELGHFEGDGFGIAAELHCDLPEVDQAVAEDLVRRAYRECPYSKATRGNIDVAIYAGDVKVDLQAS